MTRTKKAIISTLKEILADTYQDYALAATCKDYQDALWKVAGRMKLLQQAMETGDDQCT